MTEEPLIKLLSEPVRNQIAAGEVVSRPAAAVKELLENSLDAGATEITLHIKKAGKTLLQVIDNGTGMSEADAVLSFSRHATSKLKDVSDLSTLASFGFRGEALASIVAISQVEMETRREEDTTGTKICVAGVSPILSEPCACRKGTSISVKNLFFNLPARMAFLKSDALELRHIVNAFQRQALAYPHCIFKMRNDDTDIYHLLAGSLKKRIVQIFGHKYNEYLVPVTESTGIVQLSGFIGKIESAKKHQVKQFLFVNNRFIKNAYLHQAIMLAYDKLLPANSQPFYALFLTIKPDCIDVNIHPSKTEIKFTEESSVYAIVRIAVRRALAVHHISPSLDFNSDESYRNFSLSQDITIPTVTVNPLFNPFNTSSNKPAKQLTSANKNAAQAINDISNGEALYAIAADSEADNQPMQSLLAFTEQPSPENNELTLAQGEGIYQLHQSYILARIKSGWILFDQQATHERILYERYLAQFQQQAAGSQQLLFPKKVQLDLPDYTLLEGIKADLKNFGIDVELFGNLSVTIKGMPSDMQACDEEDFLLQILACYKEKPMHTKSTLQEGLCRRLAKRLAVKHGTILSKSEMQNLIDQLFACEIPDNSPTGKRCCIQKTNLDDIIDLKQITSNFVAS